MLVQRVHKPELGSVLPHAYVLVHNFDIMCDQCAPALDTYLANHKEVVVADSKPDKGYQSRTVS